MLLRTRKDEHGLDTELDTRELAERRAWSLASPAMPCSRTRPIVGRQRLRPRGRDSPGRRAQGALDLRDHGRTRRRPRVELDRAREASGRHALRDALEQLGFKVEGNTLNQAFKRFKEIADRKKQVTALDLEAIVSDQVRDSAARYELAWFDVEASTRREPHAKVAVTMPDGNEAVGESGGDGPVDAIFGAVRAATKIESELRQYTVSAVTEGEDALGDVTVMLHAHGRLASGQGVATDILEASARAYIRALSNALEGAAVREAEGVAAEAASAPATPGP